MTIILPLVLYGCEIWSLTLRKEHRLRVFENRMPRGIFGPKRDKITGGWRKLHNKEILNLYSPPSIIRMIKSRRVRWGGHVAWIRAKRNVYMILVGMPEETSPLGRPRHRRLNNIKLSLREIGRVVWTGLIWFRKWTS
jgi:hypothetical protein